MGTPYFDFCRSVPDDLEHQAWEVDSLRRVVFPRTLDHVDWANTTIARGDVIEEIAKLRAEGDGEIAAAGGISFVRSLVRHDLVDEYRLTAYPYLVGSGATLFDVSQPRALDLAGSVTFTNGVVGLTYRRRTGLPDTQS